MSEDVVDQLMDQYCQEKYIDQWDLQGFNRAFEAVFSELPEAQWELAGAYASGRGLARDHVTAQVWYIISAENGFLFAKLIASPTSPRNLP